MDNILLRVSLPNSELKLLIAGALVEILLILAVASIAFIITDFVFNVLLKRERN